MNNFDADKPIKTSSEDLPGRSGYAKAIATAIINQKGDDSHVIGLYGRWGSGKTSTLNMVAEAIAQATANKDDAPRIVIFSSWGSGSVAQLLGRFCDALQEVNYLGKAKKSAKELMGLLDRYGDLLEKISPRIGCAASAVGRLSVRSNSPIEIKCSIGNVLKKQKRKIVVVIDDIDRLSDEQIRHVFQFVNSVADFPNVIYVLPFDYSVVAAALSGVQEANGEAYMHKVIQVPLVLPDPQSDGLLNCLSDGIEGFINQGRDDYSQERLWEVTNSLIAPRVNTMRDVRRLQNVFRFQSSILGDDLNGIDILGISALIAFDPLLYEWVKGNRQFLLGFHFGEEPEDRKKAIASSLGRLGRDAEEVQGMLQCLFPSMCARFGIDEHAAWRERRVCHEDIFDCYFSCGRANPFPEHSVSDALYEGDIDFLGRAADLAISSGAFNEYLEEINSRLNGVERGFAAELASMLLSKLGAAPSLFAERGFLAPSLNQRIGFMVNRLLSKIGKERSHDVLSDAIGEMGIDALAAFSRWLNSEELAHGRLAATSLNPDKQHLTPAGLESVEKIYLARVKKLSGEPNFFMSENLMMLVYLWLCYDEAGCKRYWGNTFDKNPIAICYFIATNAGRWDSSNGQFGWTFSREIMEPILPRETALERIKSLRKGNAFAGLDTNVLLKTIVYYLDGYDSLKAEKTSAAEAEEMVLSWVD